MCAILSSIVGLIFVLFKPQSFTSSTQLLVYVKEIQRGPEPIVSPGRADLTQVQNEIEIIRSRGNLAKVVQSLDLSADNEFVPEPTLIRMLSDWALFGPKPPTMPSGEKLDTAVNNLEKLVKVQRVGTSHTVSINVTTSDPNRSRQIADALGQFAQQARVNIEQEGNRSPLLRERLQGLGPSAYVITTASIPGRPDGPRKSLIILTAAIAGIFIGSVFALLQDLKNQTMRMAAQVEYFGIECIGAIPWLKWGSSNGAKQSLSQHASDRDNVSHAMLEQTLRRTLVAAESPKTRVIGVASTTAGEGATTVAHFLAQLMARSQKTVLFVDASRADFVTAFKEKGSVDLACVSGQGIQTRYDILRSGKTGLDILRIVGSDLENIRRLDAYDAVVVDLPSLERGPEFRLAARDVDGIVLVLKWGFTTFETVERAIRASGIGSAEVIGAIFNMIDERMIGKFGDKLWEAEAKVVAQRPPLKFQCLAS
jgi:capsular polysaccharide biosynthesis protein